MKYKKILLCIGMISMLFLTTGCKRDDMEDIDIVVTNYPNEYIVEELYGTKSNITSIYPDGVDIDTYKITQKQKEDYSKKDLFVYNGLIEKERDLAVELLDLNSDLKIIDTAYVLETDYSPEELWLNPSSLLMMSQNVRLGLKEYIDSTYLKDEIDDAYNELKVKLSELDADYRLTVENTDNKTIVVANTALRFLEKFGLKVICLDGDATEKDIYDVKNLIKEGNISYIFNFEEDELNTNAQAIIDAYPDIKVLEVHKLDNLSDNERDEGLDYIKAMNENLETLKKELYQ